MKPPKLFWTQYPYRREDTWTHPKRGNNRIILWLKREEGINIRNKTSPCLKKQATLPSPISEWVKKRNSPTIVIEHSRGRLEAKSSMYRFCNFCYLEWRALHFRPLVPARGLPLTSASCSKRYNDHFTSTEDFSSEIK